MATQRSSAARAPAQGQRTPVPTVQQIQVRRRQPRKKPDGLRIGAAWSPGLAADYRVIEPLKAMERRGHEVIWPSITRPEGFMDVTRLAGCNVVHVYHRRDPASRQVIERLRRIGVAITWDVDDDYLYRPRGYPEYRQAGGAQGRRDFEETVTVARLARVVTTTSDVLAGRYREAGVERVEVIPNALGHRVRRRRKRHPGIVIGWVAGREHIIDVRQIPIVDALHAVMERHEDVRVECIGVDLGLTERYQHDALVPFTDLPARIGAFDIAIAPLASLRFNAARSDIKLKEYAASGVPWLASPVGPYADHGEAQGGRLVQDDGWGEALEALVTDKRERKRLGRLGKRWASQEQIGDYASRWEDVFLSACGRR